MGVSSAMETKISRPLLLNELRSAIKLDTSQEPFERARALWEQDEDN